MVTNAKEKWAICYDTICSGYTPVVIDSGIDNPDGTPIEFDTEAEAQAEIDSDPEFYQDECFPCLMSAIGHKTIYTGKE